MKKITYIFSKVLFSILLLSAIEVKADIASPTIVPGVPFDSFVRGVILLGGIGVVVLISWIIARIIKKIKNKNIQTNVNQNQQQNKV